MSAPVTRRRRGARVRSGRALLGAFAHTLSLLRWLLFGLVAIYLGSGITRVGPQEDALIYRLGRLQREVHPPGLLWALPPPFDRVVRVPTRVQHERFLNLWSPDENSETLDQAVQSAANGNTGAATSAPRGLAAEAARLAAATETKASGATPAPTTPAKLNPALLATFPTGASSVSHAASHTADVSPEPPPPGRGFHPVYDGYTLTGDANVIQTRFTIRYRIVDPLAWVSWAQEGSNGDMIDAVVYEAATRALAERGIDEALGSGLESWREEVRRAAQAGIDRLDSGVELVAFEVNLLTPPSATVDAFAEVTSAQVEARTVLEQARTYRAQVEPKAQGDAYRLRQQADADGQQLVSRAKGEAASFLALLAEYRRAPDLVKARLRSDALTQFLQRAQTKTLLPADGSQLNLYVPSTP